MTKNEAKEFAKVLNAYAEGKTIQMRIDDTWEDFRGLGQIMFNAGHKNYRVKPIIVKYRRYIYTNKYNESFVGTLNKITKELLGDYVSHDRNFVKWLDDDWIEQEV